MAAPRPTPFDDLIWLGLILAACGGFAMGVFFTALFLRCA